MIGRFKNPNFTVTDEIRYISVLEEWAVELTHKITGAKVLKIFASSGKNIFSISFNTMAENNIGIPHIVEHCVLKGTRKYPVSDAWQIYKLQSPCSFSNAFTCAEHTIFELVTGNKQDYFNFVDVTLDSVFHATFTEHPEIVCLEGCHKHIDLDEDGNMKIVYSGIVHNEMSGRLIDEIQMQRILFANGSYHFVHGGIPSEIRNVSIDEVSQFYNKYYCPQNSNIILYSNGDFFEQELTLLNNYLQSAQNQGQRHHYKMAINSSKIVTVKGEKSFLVGGIITGNLETMSCQEYLILHMLPKIMHHSIDSSRQFNSVDIGFTLPLRLYQVAFYVRSRQQWNQSHMPLFQDLVKQMLSFFVNDLHQNLSQTIHNELFQEALVDAVQYFQEKLKQPMFLLDFINEGWLNSKQYSYFLNFEKEVQQFNELSFNEKRELVTHFVQKFVSHEITFGVVEKQVQDSSLVGNTSDDQFADILEWCESFHEFAQKPDTEGNVSKIPLLDINMFNLTQLDLRMRNIKSFNNSNIYVCQINLNPSVKQVRKILFELTDLFEINEYQWLQFAADSYQGVLNNFNVEKEVQFDVKLDIYPVFEGFKSFLRFEVESPNQSRNEQQIIDMLLTLVFSFESFALEVLLQVALAQLSYYKKVKDDQSYLEKEAMHRSLSQFSLAGVILSETSGVNYVGFLIETLQSQNTNLVQIVVQLLMKAVYKGKMLIYLEVQDLKRSVEITSEALLMRDIIFAERPVDMKKYRNEAGYKPITQSVGFQDAELCSCVQSFYPFPATAATLVAQNILKDQLFNRVRVNGGAYDLSVRFQNLDHLIISSKFDGNIKSTRGHFSDLEQILGLEIPPSKLELHKRGAICDMMRVIDFGFEFYLHQVFNQRDPAFIVQELRKVKDIKIGDIAEVAPYFGFVAQSKFVAAGSLSQIRKVEPGCYVV